LFRGHHECTRSARPDTRITLLARVPSGEQGYCCQTAPAGVRSTLPCVRARTSNVWVPGESRGILSGESHVTNVLESSSHWNQDAGFDDVNVKVVEPGRSTLEVIV